jgi:hypothetical protein
MFNEDRIYFKPMRTHDIPEVLNLFMQESAIMLSEFYGNSLEEADVIGIGYGTLISKLTLKMCFEELNLNKVIYKIREDNNWIPNRVENQLTRNVPVNKDKAYSYYYGEISIV